MDETDVVLKSVTVCRTIDLDENIRVIFTYQGRETVALVLDPENVLGAAAVRCWQGDEFDLAQGEKMAVRKALDIGLDNFPSNILPEKMQKTVKVLNDKYRHVYSLYRSYAREENKIRGKIGVPLGWKSMQEYHAGTKALFLMRDNSVVIKSYENFEDYIDSPEHTTVYKYVPLGFQELVSGIVRTE